MTQTSTDPIADMLSRIRNAIAVNKTVVEMPHSKVKESIARLLKDTTYIDGFETRDENVGKTLIIAINQEGSNSRITEISRMSSPGRRYYAKSEKIPIIKRGRGIVVVSTSKGIMTGDEAKKQKIGGELICKVY